MVLHSFHSFSHRTEQTCILLSPSPSLNLVSDKWRYRKGKRIVERTVLYPVPLNVYMSELIFLMV